MGLCVSFPGFMGWSNGGAQLGRGVDVLGDGREGYAGVFDVVDFAGVAFDGFYADTWIGSVKLDRESLGLKEERGEFTIDGGIEHR